MKKKSALGELRSLLQKFSNHNRIKNLRIATQKGKKKQLHFACLISSGLHCSLPKGNLSTRKGSPHWERENRVSDQLRQLFRALYEESTSALPHWDSSKAEMYSYSKKQGRRTGTISQTVGVTMAPCDLLCKGPWEFLPPSHRLTYRFHWFLPDRFPCSQKPDTWVPLPTLTFSPS